MLTSALPNPKRPKTAVFCWRKQTAVLKCRLIHSEPRRCHNHDSILDLYEGGREIRPWTHRIVLGTHVISKIYSVPLRYSSKPLMLCSEPLNLKSANKCLMSYLIKTNSDYHNGVHFVAVCKFWNIAKKRFYRLVSCCVKCKRNFFIIYFLSLKQRQPLMVWITYRLSYDNYKELTVKMEMRREGKEVAFPTVD